MSAAFAPGKVIVLGEHAVVYGHAALAGPLSRGVTARTRPSPRCRLVVPAPLTGPRRAALSSAFARAARACGEPPVTVSLEADLPLSMGLGSSAAVSVACARALLHAAGRAAAPARVLEVAMEMEREFHGQPSGVDHSTSARAALIAFRRGPKGAPRIREVRSPRPLRVLVALVGERRATRETVGALRARCARWPALCTGLMAQIGRVVEEGVRAVQRGELEALGELMNVNHGLLSALQLSSASLDAMVHRLRGLGALGAKLTGAGGDGGAVIGLFRDPSRAQARLSREGVPCFSSQLAGPGAR